MSVDYFKRVLKKIKQENAEDRCRIEIYNWGEPLLHPDIAAIVEAVSEYSDFRCGISSNLSHSKMDIEGALRAGPASLRVSLSGFYPESYSQTHVRGDIQMVKTNMVRVREIIDQYDLKTAVTVAYHIYKHNAGEELEAMRKFCDQIGFLITPNWANFYPLEKVTRYFDGQVSEKDRGLLAKLVFSPEEQLEFAKSHRARPCALQEHTVINHDGSVGLCCATYDPSSFISNDFLAVSAQELAKTKRKSEICDQCISRSYHAMMCGYGMEAKDESGNQKVRFVNGFRLAANRLVKEKP